MPRPTGKGGEPAITAASTPPSRRPRRSDIVRGAALVTAIVATSAAGAWLLKPAHPSAPAKLAAATATAPRQTIVQPATAPRAPAGPQIARQAELIPHAASSAQLPELAPLPALRIPLEAPAVEQKTTQAAPVQRSAQAAPEVTVSREPAMVPLSSGDSPKPVMTGKPQAQKRKGGNTSKADTPPRRKVAQGVRTASVRTADAGFSFWTPTAVKIRPLK